MARPKNVRGAFKDGPTNYIKKHRLGSLSKAVKIIFVNEESPKETKC